MTGILDKTLNNYEIRQIVARVGKAGSFTIGGKSYHMPEYMTFWCGEKPSFAAKFDRLAPMDEKGFLRLDALREGEIVVKPGLVYRKVAMTGMVMDAHLKAMQKFRKKVVTAPVMSDEAPIDVGVIDLTTGGK